MSSPMMAAAKFELNCKLGEDSVLCLHSFKVVVFPIIFLPDYKLTNKVQSIQVIVGMSSRDGPSGPPHLSLLDD